ncbi:hypothetical protein [Pseudoluteimonas lycopersici]|uniref:hypothetical protein n=1 Tax=Pseudoluteimonas lycopersici TaxID=1324796 RepID=UPI00163DBD0D|nr:hypothetical protein [Lysobacter lycopersici]
MNRRPDPLDADERALADLLARDALPGPSPQLDARILAAARAAIEPARASRRPRPRWIAGMSIAATLVLAVGIAWRLRPLPHRAPAAQDTSVSAVRMIEPPARTASPQPPAAADAVYRRMRSPPAQVLSKPVPTERESAAAADKVSPPPEPAVAFDEPSPMDTQAPPPAPPPPPAPAVAQKPAANAMAAPAASTMQAAKSQPPAAAAAPEAFEPARAKEEARTLDRIETTGSRIRRDDAFGTGRVDAAAVADAAAEDGVPRAVLDQEPPATADSPQVRDAWLQRIRELLSAGETEAARNSLAEFRRRYPKYALPEDLQRFTTP